MEEKNTTGTSKQSYLLASATEDELCVAQILLDLRKMVDIVESLPGCKWGRKRRRSCLDDDAAPPSSSSPSLRRTVEENKPQPNAAEDDGAAATSPVTPLSFSPGESDEKTKRSLKKCSKKRTREEYIEMIQELTQNKFLFRGEIKNVHKHRKNLEAFNSELTAIHQVVLNSFLKKEEPKLAEMNGGTELSPFENPLGLMKAQFNSQENHLGQIGLPDLNKSFEEAHGVEQSQPLDLVADRRARSAEARRIRREIIKSKSNRGTGRAMIV